MTKPQKTNRSQGPSGHIYQGKYSDQQVYGSNFKGKRYGKNIADSFNDYQNFLYNRALFGLAVYSPEEVKEMHWDKRKRIIKVHKRAQTVLNLWKQSIVVELSNIFFQTLFPRMEITQQLVDDKAPTDPEFINKMSFKSLRITRTQVISKLIQEGVLPINFNELKPQEFAS